MPTTSDNTQELEKAIEYMANLVGDDPSLRAERFNQNGHPSLLIYNARTRPEKFRVILNGHIDVVPAKLEQFKAIQKDGKLYGRGALDMKVAAVTMANVFRDTVSEVNYPLALQIVADEETGGQHGTLHQIEQGVAADFVIAGEFTPLGAICTESKGICWLEITCTGESAHSAYLWNGKNAIVAAQGIIQKLLALYPVPESEDWVTTVNIASIQTDNTTFNKVPDEATVQLDIRYVPNDKNFKNKESVEKLIHSLDGTAKVSIMQLEPSHFADSNDQYIQTLATCLENQSIHPSFIRKHGASDIRFYSDRGTPAVALGLQGIGLHGDEECLEIGSVDRYYNVLHSFLLSANKIA